MHLRHDECRLCESVNLIAVLAHQNLAYLGFSLCSIGCWPFHVHFVSSYCPSVHCRMLPSPSSHHYVSQHDQRSNPNFVVKSQFRTLIITWSFLVLDSVTSQALVEFSDHLWLQKVEIVLQESLESPCSHLTASSSPKESRT